MRSLAELAPHLRGLRGIFTDIDDTLTHRGTLVPAAYAALAQAARIGLRVVAVTGRPAGWADVLATLWPVDAVVAENGAVAVRVERAGDGRPTTTRFYFADDAAREAARPRLAAISADVLAHVPRARLADDQPLRRTDLAFDIGETQSLPDADIREIRRRVEAGGARTLESSVHLHACFGDHDKVKMAVRLARQLFGEELDLERERYVFVGDSPNDQAGFAYFPLSVGVANVARYAAVLAPPPRFITMRPGGEGFAELVELIVRNR